MKNVHLSRLSFRMHIALMFGATVLVIITVLSLLLGRMQATTVRNNAGAALQLVANNAQRVLALSLHNRLMIVQGLADSPALWAHGLDSDAVRMALSQQQVVGTHLAWLGVATRDGIVRASSGSVLLGADVSKRPWFRAGLQALHVGDLHEALLLAKLLPPSSTGEPQRFVDFAAPIRIDGEVRGVIALHGSWEWARSLIESQLPDDAQSLSLDLVILDRNGIVIYAPIDRPDPHVKLGDRLPEIASLASRSVTTSRWPDGRSYLTALVTLQPREAVADLGWKIVARMPKELADAPVQSALMNVAFVGGLAALCAMLLAWFVAGAISKPLSAIGQAADDVVHGKAGATIPNYAGNSELKRLSSALIGMTEELETRVRQHDTLARFDALTELLNRRGFEERMESAVLNARRRVAPLSVIAIDVDHFKRVNDDYGHDVGDDVLRTLARILRARFRDNDVVARMGGEEFTVLLVDSDIVAARHLADELVAQVATAAFPGTGGITVSCGVSSLSGQEREGVAALKRADRALYLAKNNGRNRTVVMDAPFDAQSFEAGTALTAIEVVEA